MAKRFRARGGGLTFWDASEERGPVQDNSRIRDKPCSCCGSVTFWAFLGEERYGWTCAVCIPPLRREACVMLSILKKPVRIVPRWW